jgi:hypothetical protein
MGGALGVKPADSGTSYWERSSIVPSGCGKRVGGLSESGSNSALKFGPPGPRKPNLGPAAPFAS